METMHLTAFSIGESVPRDTFDASVQSSFESALNLRLVNEDRLVTLLNSEFYELPQGIRVWASGLALQGVAPGTRVALRGGVLRFEGATLCVDLRSAPVWKSQIPETAIDMTDPPVWAAWQSAWVSLNVEQRSRETEIVGEQLLQSGKGTVLSRRIQPALEQVLVAVRHQDAVHAAQAAAGLVGLGPGVTPSGDDLLIGLLAAQWAGAARLPKRKVFLNQFMDGMMEAARQTGEISRTYLMLAGRGQFSSALSQLVAALGSDTEVEEAVQVAMRIGHSSGMDTVTGLLLGLLAERNKNDWLWKLAVPQ